jgi:hypothetical protein
MLKKFLFLFRTFYHSLHCVCPSFFFPHFLWNKLGEMRSVFFKINESKKSEMKNPIKKNSLVHDLLYRWLRFYEEWINHKEQVNVKQENQVNTQNKISGQQITSTWSCLITVNTVLSKESLIFNDHFTVTIKIKLQQKNINKTLFL